MEKNIESFIDLIKSKNPNEPEFIQAVSEVAEAVIPFIEKNPQYASDKLLERMAEPERVTMFRVLGQTIVEKFK